MKKNIENLHPVSIYNFRHGFIQKLLKNIIITNVLTDIKAQVLFNIKI